MKGEKKLLVGVGALVTICIIFGWKDTLSIAQAKDNTASAKTEIIIGANESEKTEATVKEHIDFELRDLSIIEKDIQEKQNESRIIIPITDSREFIGDSVYSETPDDNGSGTGGAEGNSERSASSGDRAYTSAGDENAEGDTGTVSASEEVDTGSGRLADEAGLEDEGTGEEDSGTGEDSEYDWDADEPGYDWDADESSSDMDESGYFESATDYESEDGSDSGNLIYLGEFTITFYDDCEMCVGANAGLMRTASGTTPTANHTIAADGFDFGTTLYIEGFGYYVVEDRGVPYGWCDIYVNDHSEVPSYGITTTSVYLAG